MTWTKREAVTNLVVLGDGEGQVKKVAGLLIGMPHDRRYPDKQNFELVQKDGEVLVLSGSASIARQIFEEDIGRFVKCEFEGWDRSGNGKFKVINVQVYEGEATEAMKAWPRFAEFQKKPKPAAQVKQDAKPKDSAEFEEFPGALADEDDDLPF